ncbi:electron transfer flavoprotein subunit beta/FixA family protein [Niallia sp. Krafla_26]|uniref:electron transfer flavoprotein subunit beta/FixA family protein n=1 Tax=Niallia sp. Krafla_26 TaxID=3064703 RepID=UPI003D17C4E4
MKIYVIMKRTFDTEEKIIIQNGEIQDDSVEFIINPYDEYAIEEAIKLREAHGGEVTVLTVGVQESEKQLRTALAIGADKAVLVDIEELDEVDANSISIILATYLSKQEPDIILSGNVAVDGGSGQVGPQVAERLGIPQVTTITKLDIKEGVATVVRDVEGDQEIIKVSLPLLVTAQQGLNEPRYPSLPGIMKAKKKPLDVLEIEDLDLDVNEISAKTKTIDIFLPREKQAGKLLSGTVKEQAANLLSLLKSEAKVI